MEQHADSGGAGAESRRVYVVLIALIGLTLLLYARVIHFEFLSYDDYDYVRTNPNLVGGLSPKSIGWAFTTGERANWHPVTWLSYLLETTFFGVRPDVMHATNALLHSASAGLLFLLLLRLTGDFWPSAWVAALFAWHPLHVESVAWVAERKDVLCAFFMFLCLLAYERYARAPSLLRYAAVAALLALALLSKPMAVTVPCVMVLLDIWPLKRLEGGMTLRRLILEKWPLFALVLISSVITYFVQSSGRAVASVEAIPLGVRLANAVIAYGAYLRMMIAPYGLAVFYPHPGTYPGGAISAVKIIASAIVLIAISALAWRTRRALPWMLVGWLWYVGMLVPVIGIIQVGKQSMADRYTYVPLIGIFIAIAWTLRAIPRRAAAALAIGSAAVCLPLTWIQIGYWRNTETLMRRAIAVVPNNYVAHASLADALAERGDVAGAIREYETTLAIRPNDPVGLYSMAKFAAAQGRTAEAIDYYERAIKADPSIPAAYSNLGILFSQTGRLDDAIDAYKKALVGDPTLDLAHSNLAGAMLRKGQLDDAIGHWQEAVRLRPDFVDAHFSLSQALLMARRTPEALNHLRQAAKLAPRRVDILNRLAWTLCTWPDPAVHNAQEAVTVAATACQLTQNGDPTSLDVLAAAFARAGQFDQALQAADLAARLAEAQPNPAFARAIRARISLYQRRQPYTEPG